MSVMGQARENWLRQDTSLLQKCGSPPCDISFLEDPNLKIVHYSDKPFVLQPIKIRNGDLPVKPTGGLWASPSKAEFGWREWCQLERFALERFKHKVILDVDTSHFITIDDISDLEKLPWFKPYGLGMEAIDFEKLKREGIDGIILTNKGEAETRFTRPRTLYGWDCESVLILNERCIKKISGKKV